MESDPSATAMSARSERNTVQDGFRVVPSKESLAGRVPAGSGLPPAAAVPPTPAPVAPLDPMLPPEALALLPAEPAALPPAVAFTPPVPAHPPVVIAPPAAAAPPILLASTAVAPAVPAPNPASPAEAGAPEPPLVGAGPDPLELLQDSATVILVNVSTPVEAGPSHLESMLQSLPPEPSKRVVDARAAHLSAPD